MKWTCPSCKFTPKREHKAGRPVPGLFYQDAVKPTAGDFTVCPHCSEILEIQPDLSVTMASLTRLMEIGEENRAELGRIQEIYRKHPL